MHCSTTWRRCSPRCARKARAPSNSVASRCIPARPRPIGPPAYWVERSGRQLGHDAIKPRLALEADAGAVAQGQIAVVQRGVVGKAAEIAEHTRIGFGAAQPEA